MDPFDLPTLFALRESIEGLDANAPPELRVLTRTAHARNVALLPGSFNPPTAAHLLLAERALREGFDAVVMTLARTTAGKRPSGLILEDRLLALRIVCDRSIAVGLCSHGLYADQAEAAERAFPGAELSFLVGSDKVLQIFEGSWYDDLSAALERLFSRARLVVAPRSNQAEQVKDVLRAPENRAWADRVEVLRLHPAVSDLSSTRVRGLLRSGADPAGLVPQGVAELLETVRAFAPPLTVGVEEIDVYALRARLIDLLWAARGDGGPDVDLRSLVGAATAADEAGRRLREDIARGTIPVDALARASAG